MTINLADNTPRIVYTVAEGVEQTTFTVPFEFFDSSDLNVYADNVLQVEGTDYAVIGGDGATGSIEFASFTGGTGGSSVLIYRRVQVERTSDFSSGAEISRPTLNEQLDALTAMVADVNDRVDRSVRSPDSDLLDGSMELPDISTRAGKYFAFGADGAPSMTDGVDSDIVVSAFFETLADDDSVTEFLGTLGITSTVAQLNYSDGVTSNIQTQLDSKQSLDATLTALSGTLTAAGKVPYATATDTAGELDFVDEDDMASDSATAIPSQQSVKAYADAIAAAVPIVEIARVTVSNDATVEFDSADFDNATYDSYEFEFINVRPATDGAYLRYRSSSDGGTTFDSGASDYKVAADGFGSDGVNADFGDQSIDYGILAKWNCGNSAGEPGLSGELKVYGPGDTVYTLFRAATGTITAAGDAQVSDVVSVRLSAAEVNGLQFYFSTGNLESGTIIMRGYKGA